MNIFSIFSENILIVIYWLFALTGALVFWKKGRWYVFAPLSAFGLGMFLFLNSPNVFSLSGKGVLFVSLLCLEVIFLKYSSYKEEEETVTPEEEESSQIHVP